MNIDASQMQQIPSLRRLWKEAFGDDDAFLDKFFNTAFSFERSRCVTEKGEITAALYWFDCLHADCKIAYIYAVATSKERRGKGLCRELMQDTHRYLAEHGYEGAILVPGGDELFAFYERMDYLSCANIREISCSAVSSDIKIRFIAKDEYAKLRRKFLPASGVIQENENLDFLETQAIFCTGDSFLLAFRREKGILYGIELLGDADLASSITYRLSCSEGRFRVPGDERVFAMYSPLDGSKHTPPSYFGLAFD